MSNTVLTNNNEKEHENGSVTLDFGNRVVRSLSHSAANVHTSNSGILITFTNPYPLMIFCRYSNLEQTTCSRDRYITHFYCLAVEAGFYSDMVECLPLDPAAQVRFPPWAVGIFLHPVTFGGQYGDP